MKILNLYAGIGGNRKLWGDTHEITAVELVPEIANIYKDFYPNDTMIIGDAHEYLLEHYKEYDFIWSSPPCQSHSKVRMMASKSGSYDAVMPDMKLWTEIMFLTHYAKGKWVIENVIPYYKPFIQPKQCLERHLFWCNFRILYKDFRKPETKHNQVTGKTERFGIALHGIKTKHRKDQIIRNCVNPEIGLHVLEQAQTNELDLFTKEKE